MTLHLNLRSRLGLVAYCERCDLDVTLPHGQHAGHLMPYDSTWHLRRAWADAHLPAPGPRGPGYPWDREQTLRRWVDEKRDPLLTRLHNRARRLLRVEDEDRLVERLEEAGWKVDVQARVLDTAERSQERRKVARQPVYGETPVEVLEALEERGWAVVLDTASIPPVLVAFCQWQPRGWVSEPPRPFRV